MSGDTNEITGRYRHFKGGLYTVCGIARHSETMEEFVLYENDAGLWIRPRAMFFENVTRDGRTFPRFEKVEP